MKNIEDYPYIMTAGDLANFLQVSPPTAYERLRTDLRHKAFTLNGSAAARGNIRIFRDDVVEHYRNRQKGA